MPADDLTGTFPSIDLPIAPPYPPMEATSAAAIPAGPEWVYEPKWDGLRCLAFKRNREVLLQSKSGQPLGRYFPELVAALAALSPSRMVNEDGEIDHVGFTSSFTAEERAALKPIMLRLRGGRGFTGRAPGGPSRWSANRSTDWEPLDPKLVCEVRYDHFSGHRFRHGTKFLRWRPDKSPRQSAFDQVRAPRSTRALAKLGIIG